MAIGAQERFDWKGVALSALGSGISAGLASPSLMGGSSWQITAVRMATANALTQGVAVATGLQKSFDWKGVAASAVGAGVGAAVSGPLTNVLGDFGGRFATGLVAGTVAAIARGGKVAIQQVAVDAFGNAVGQSLAYSNGQATGSGSGMQEDRLGTFIENNQDEWDSRIITTDMNDALIGALGNQTIYSRDNDVLLAAGPASGAIMYDNGQPVGGPGINLPRVNLFEPEHTLPEVTVVEAAYRSRSNTAWLAAQAQATTDVYASGAGDVRGPFYESAGQAPDIPGIAGGYFDANGEAWASPATSTAVSEARQNLSAPRFNAQDVDQQILNGSYNAFSAVGGALSDGRFGDAWQYATYTPSDQARAASVARVYPQPSPNIARIDKMIASPIGASMSVLTGLLGGSQRAQDRMLDYMGAWEGIAGSMTGTYKHTLTARPPSYNALGARIDNVINLAALPFGGRIVGATRAEVQTGARLVANSTLHPGQLAAFSGEVSQASILHTLRQAGTPESLATAKLISKGKLNLNILPAHPKGYGGEFNFGTNYVNIYANRFETSIQAAGYTAHEGTHFIQGLNRSTYHRGHEFDAFRVQGKVDKDHWSQKLTDQELYDEISSLPAYSRTRPDPNWPR